MRLTRKIRALTLFGLFANVLCPRLSASPVNVAAGFRTLPVAPLGESNPWPMFRFQIKGSPVVADKKLTGEDIDGLFGTTAIPPLPYLIQDGYSRERHPGRLPTVTAESDTLRAILYPSLGGRLISLYDKTRQRELLFDNPVFQPANLAIRNAWFSGGIEWNGPLYGHSLLTCSPVFVGRVDTTRGPIVRVYEFDRVLETTWQVDLFLPQDACRLWVHVKAVNLNSHDIRFYWWTNIAVPLTRETRVLVPMDYTVAHSAFSSGIEPRGFPFFDGFDGSYPARYPYSQSIFFRKPGSVRAWSACVDGEGRGLCHVSTTTLSGRKLFTWGSGRGGQRWMDYLSEIDKGDYIEIQGGIAPTQLQTRPLKAGASIEWTECITPLAFSASAAHDPDYARAVTAAGQILDQSLPTNALHETDRFLRAQANTPISATLAQGAGWGLLHEQLTGKRLGPGLAFETPLHEEERPWQELVEQGTFSAKTLAQPPRSFAVSPLWTAALRHSMKTRGATWLHHLNLGVAQLEAGEFETARASFEASLKLKKNALAERCLALLAERGGAIDAANAAYLRAWALCGESPSLAIEICGFLERHDRTAACEDFVRTLPPTVVNHERIQLTLAKLALARGDDSSVRKILQREFGTIREGELSLSELWFASWIQDAAKRQGRDLTEPEKQAVREKNPPPQAIDFRMK